MIYNFWCENILPKVVIFLKW